MERIRSTGTGGFRKYGKSGSKKDSSSVEEARKVSFAELWKAESSEPAEESGGVTPSSVEEDIETLVDDIHSRGENLKEQPNLENIKKYKEAVRDFLSYVVRNTLEVETKEGARFNPLKKQKKYTLVHVIDEKLEQLAAGIMQNQGAQMDILRRVEEINGLVVDLTS